MMMMMMMMMSSRTLSKAGETLFGGSPATR
jgi:hypothetical protein